jgi:hypothetical protein
VREELASRDPFTAHQVQVVARIFADVQRLATTYGETGLIPHTAAFAEFVRGFNVGDAMCDYLDVGSEKRRSDEKIQGAATITVSKLSHALTFRSNVSTRSTGYPLQPSTSWLFSKERVHTATRSIRDTRRDL